MRPLRGTRRGLQQLEPGQAPARLPATPAPADSTATADGASSGSSGGSADAAGGTGDANGASAASTLAGIWTVMTGGIVTMVTIGQDSLTIVSPDFTVTATRTANVLAFTDTAPPSDTSNASVLAATQTVGTFNTGILPFNLGGSWTMQAGPVGGSPTLTCTLSVTATEIDGACQYVSPVGPWFSFTTKKMTSAASSLGDFGGTWTNTWTWPGTGGGVYPCLLTFTGNSITTCAGGAMNGEVVGSPLAGITFTYDGANTVSGAAQGWSEYSATR